MHARPSPGLGRFALSPSGSHLASRYRWQRRLALATPFGLGLASLGALVLVTPGFALWSSSSSAPQQVQLGSLALGSSSPDMATAISNLVPGDDPQRELVLTNSGNLALSAITLAASSSTSNALATDTTNGLQVNVASCSVAWSTTTLSNGTTAYSCSGSLATLVNEPLATLLKKPATLVGTPDGSACAQDVCAPGGRWDLVVQLTLPGSAPSSDQGLSSILTFTATGYQVAPTTL